MSSWAIFRSLLTYIQGEAHPLYVAERQLSPARNFRLSGRAQWLFYAMLMIGAIALPALAAPLRIAPTPDNSGTLLLIGQIAGGVVSLAWIVPLAIFAGRAISRERQARTWDSLLVSPYTTDVIVLAKAAASARPVWGRALAVALVVSALRLVIVIALMIQAVNTSGLSVWWVVILSPLAGVLILLECQQEITLSMTIGVLGAFLATSPAVTSLIGGIAGGMLRIVQLIVCLWLLPRLAGAVSGYVGLTSTLTGTTILLGAAPGLVTLLVVIALVLVREALTRVTFSWALRLSHEG